MTVRRPVLLVMALLMCLALVSSMSNAAVTVTEKLYEGKADCGTSDRNYPVDGKATLTRAAVVVTVAFKITKGFPNTNYSLELWEMPSCTPYAGSDRVKTDAQGKASKTVAFLVRGNARKFFATIFGGGIFSDTVTVRL